MSPSERLRLRHLIIRWSDGEGLARATNLVEQYRHLLPGRITNAQLSGFTNIVQNVTALRDLIAFTQHQGAKAARAGRLDVKGFWDDVGSALDSLETVAAEVMAQASVPLEAPPSQRRRAPRPPETVTMQLAQEFVQHLVAHSLYLGVS